MSLVTDLSRVRTEEDVKDAYIKALGLKKYNKGLIDIQTEEIWFEAKEASTPPVLMFTQLLFYVRDARKKGEHIPPFLAVIDREKAAIMETAVALPIMADKSIKWPKSGSAVNKVVAAQAAPYIETHFVVYRMETHEKDFIAAVKNALKAGKLVRTAAYLGIPVSALQFLKEKCLVGAHDPRLQRRGYFRSDLDRVRQQLLEKAQILATDAPHDPEPALILGQFLKFSHPKSKTIKGRLLAALLTGEIHPVGRTNEDICSILIKKTDFDCLRDQ